MVSAASQLKAHKRLQRGLHQLHSVEAKIKREDRRCTRFQGKRALNGEAQLSAFGLDPDADLFLIGQADSVLKIMHKQKTATAVRTERIPQDVGGFGFDLLVGSGQNGIHRCQQPAVALQKIIDQPQGIIALAQLAKLAYGRLVIVGFTGQAETFVHKEITSRRRIAPVIHIKAQTIAAAANGTHHHGQETFARHPWPPRIGDRNTRSQLGRQRRIKSHIVTDRRIIGVLTYVFVEVKRRRPVAVHPKRISIAGHHRNRAFFDNGGITPAGSRVQGRFQAGVQRQLFEGFHVITAQTGKLVAKFVDPHPDFGDVHIAPRHRVLAGSSLVSKSPGRRRMLIFVFDLKADDRAALFEQQTPELSTDFTIEPVDIIEVCGVVAAHFDGSAIQPVGQTAVAHFAVSKGAYAHDQVQAVLFA